MRRLGLVIGGLAVGLVLAEVLLRLLAPQPTGVLATDLDPDVLATLRPNARGVIDIPGVYRFAFSHDSAGHRVSTGSRSPEAPEVLILGDSFAYGLGVDDDETAASRLAARLLDLGADVRVANAGVPGKGPAYLLRLLQTRGVDWRPDLVVYLFYPNDFANAFRQPYFAVTDSTLTPQPPVDPNMQRRLAVMSHPVFRGVRARSHLSGLLWQVAIERVGANGVPNTDMDTLHPARPWSFEQAISPTQQFLGAIRDTVNARGGTFVIAYAPTAAEVAGARRGEASVDAESLRHVTEALGVDVLYLTPTLADRPEPIADLYFPETHWRPVTHDIVADALALPTLGLLCRRGLRATACRPDAPPTGATRGDGASGESSRRTPAG